MSDDIEVTVPHPEEVPDIRAQLRAYALTFPGAYEEYPWGQVVVKVNKKVFVFLDGDLRDPALNFSVKLPVSGADVLSMPFTKPTGYGLGKAGWVSFRFDADEPPPLAMLQPWIAESYRAVAPKRLIAQLEHMPP
ncbi:MAG: MmcQ/YjbR family DNA-binding protein [Roseiflexaceae bacterium]|nr:MmcQ/YjbR family DNA-binding protein [Roseiflexaceae bacterium]